MQNRSSVKFWIVQSVGDIAALTFAYLSAYYLRFLSDTGNSAFAWLSNLLNSAPQNLIGSELSEFYVDSFPRLVLMLAAALIVSYALWGLYPGRRYIKRHSVAPGIIGSNLIILALIFAYFYLTRNVFHPRSFFVTVIVLNVFFTVMMRWAIDLLVMLLRKVCRSQINAVLAGSGQDADVIEERINILNPHGIVVRKTIRITSSMKGEEIVNLIKDAAAEVNAGTVILAERQLPVSEIMKVVKLTDELNIDLKVLSDQFNVLVNQAKIDADMIRGAPLIHFDAYSLNRLSLSFRKAMDVLFSIAAAVLMLPLMVIIGLLIKLTSRGPVLFVQERIGVNRQPFKMYKFRTMYENANEIQAQMEEFNESSDALFKIRKDPRITPAGRLLRRFSLDELPQIINIIRGEMSFVGPRPLPKRDFEHYYEDWHYSRHDGLPGLTCLWQVSGRSDLDFRQMCILDVYYLRNRSWVLDVNIIFRTLAAVLFARGAY